MIKQIQNASQWIKPTVLEVENLMKVAGENQGLDNWLDCSQLLGIGERGFRRWKSNADKTPDALSNITFWGYSSLYAMAYRKPLVEPELCDFASVIDEKYMMNAEGYKCPPKSVLTSVIGKDALLKMTRGEVAERIGMASNSLSYQINDESISFATWSQILMLCGVSPDRIFYQGENQATRKEVQLITVKGGLGEFDLIDSEDGRLSLAVNCFIRINFNPSDAILTCVSSEHDQTFGWALEITTNKVITKVSLSKANATLINDAFPQIKVA